MDAKVQKYYDNLTYLFVYSFVSVSFLTFFRCWIAKTLGLHPQN